MKYIRCIITSLLLFGVNFAIFLTCINSAQAMNVTLCWGKNAETDGVIHYLIYHSTSSFTNSNKPSNPKQVAADYTYSPASDFPAINLDTHMIYRVEGLAELSPKQRHYFAISAVNHPEDKDSESNLSLLVDTRSSSQASTAFSWNLVLPAILSQEK